jgi:hypothetical protein
LIPLAFFRPDDHQSSRSATTELRELVDVLIELAVLERSRALRSRRSPTFSVSGPVQERSAENMVTRKNEWIKNERNGVLMFPAQNERETGEVPWAVMIVSQDLDEIVRQPSRIFGKGVAAARGRAQRLLLPSISSHDPESGLYAYRRK